MPNKTRTAAVIGAGPAGLTAAHELLSRTDVVPVVFEATDRIGGISCTVEHNGNRLDIGGHRFFSKSDRVMSWWLERMPLQKLPEDHIDIAYQGQQRGLAVPDAGVDPHTTDRVMLLRERTSRIFWHDRLFEYPLSLSGSTMRNLGPERLFRSAVSYLRSMSAPIRDEDTLEDFLINRFGRELYQTFFQSYTEKVWGVACDEIPAEWGAQRIKGLSIRKALLHAVDKARGGVASDAVAQREVETSLIERFLYPKFGPGQMWEVVAQEVRDRGGEVLMNQRVVGVRTTEGHVTAVVSADTRTGEQTTTAVDMAVSSMPIPALVDAIDIAAPRSVADVARGLPFRDFFTVGLLVDGLRLPPAPGDDLIKDNWIYIQEPGVQIGRLQIFNNWSPWMVADPSTVWLGLEYFCYDTDPIWRQPDAELTRLGVTELSKIGIIERESVLDSCVVRVPKTYPAYFGSYGDFDVVRGWLQEIPNLHCVGRNGQHRYNNQDHSMLTAMLMVDQLTGEDPTADIWDVNTEEEYHEQRSS
ncbi:NAD(P)/FAD-dependent oxidoreductase [Euzebya tangerina]|uniref:NAD(P)/FAD-dependent oxidoreductase n=1 Tax=Euzebya tangerina TaxID=591198 RepID=UPI00196A9BC7|nr:NAD(P)/FAD-dependent oxidoreductase [Euzebya tangerina]